MASSPQMSPSNYRQPLNEALITPSALTNRLLGSCLAFKDRVIGWQLINQTLEDNLHNAIAAKEAFWNQITQYNLRELIPAPINMVIEAFDEYGQALLYTRNSVQDPQQYPLETAVVLIHDSYMALYEAMLAYEWSYLGQGDEPHPALNLLQKSISAVHQRLMPNERFNDILDRLWGYFIDEEEEAKRTMSNPTLCAKRLDAIGQSLSGIEVMDEYFEAYDVNYLLTGYERCHQGCLLIIEQIQEMSGEALAEAPTPSPQVNWVIHTAKAVIDGLDPQLLTKAQSWFESQLNESQFRFEQYATMAAENPTTSRLVMSQIAIARDGFDRFNRALPLLRLGLDRRHLLVKAIRHLEEGANLINQAYEVLEQIERDGEPLECVHCGFTNTTKDHVCRQCGAKIMRVFAEEVPVVATPVPATVATVVVNPAPATASPVPATMASAHVAMAPATAVPNLAPANSPAIQPNQTQPPVHIARLLKAIESARSGNLSLDTFTNDLAWGRKLHSTALQSTARLPEHSPDQVINSALHSLRCGLQSFNNALLEMEAYQSDFNPAHLDNAAAMLLQACEIFTALQTITGKKRG